MSWLCNGLAGVCNSIIFLFITILCAMGYFNEVLLQGTAMSDYRTGEWIPGDCCNLMQRFTVIAGAKITVLLKFTAIM